MMAGTGVSVGGAGMLRARRRDVSVKPNRKLDRKSSRGMIYENEELRLRTIHINAEVEQGQNDIKKLRKENEQLRREIWSLRDEYDKLEEILKRQKSREESEEYEIRSDEDDGPQSDYSLEEEEEEEEEEVEDDVDEEFDEDKTTQVPGRDLNKAEQLENAENQKISSEKMTSSVHRLHVDFDDLSVVDEEEELKRDKDNKVSTEEGQLSKEEKSPSFPILKPRHLHENIPFYPAAYQPPDLSTPSYYAECPFKFPSTMNLMMTSGMQEMAATRLQTEPLLPGMTVSTLDQANDQMVHAPPAGWQTNLTVAQKQMTPFGTVDVGVPSAEAFGRDQHRFATFSTFAAPVVQRRHVAKQANCAYSATPFGDPTNPEAIAENGWSFDIGSSNPLGDQSPGDSRLKDGEEKPKHFFAPLPSKTKRQMPEDSSPTISHFGTGSSSCSAKTESTVVSKSHLMCQKGSADVYVNGAIACEDGVFRHKTEQRTFLSTDNLLIADDKSSSVNQLTKSMSCQDLSSESQPATISTEARPQIMTQSDNTLDNISDSKPYRSHISVTLKRLPRKQTFRPRTPEVPKLPAMDYRLFNNPFLRTFDPTSSYRDPENVTTPLSVQVNDDNPRFFRSQPAFQQRGQLGGTDAQHNRYRPVQAEQNRLLMPTNQLLNGKLVPPAPKHEIQVTSFEKPSPHTLIGPSTSYELSNLRRINPNPYLQSQNLYQNVPFMSRTGMYPQRGMMYYDSSALKVPVQTQTSIDGDSHHEDEQAYSHEESVPSTPSGQRRKRTVRKEKLPAKNNLSPLAQRRTLKKQISVASSEIPESPGKRQRSRRLSITTTTASEGQEDKHESRSSSSGQDSPKKDQTRRVSLYFNTKKRPSLASVKTTRSGSVDMLKEKDGMLNSERERTTSTSSSRDTPAKSRKASTSSGSVPWCACWGNGCI